MSVDSASIRKMVFWPAIVTLAITLLRLTGELMDWPSALFNRAPGGGGALVGISWLPPIFGILFAIALVRAGHGPVRRGRAVGMAFAGLAAVIVLLAGLGAAGLIREDRFSLTALLLMTAAMAIGAAIAWSGWPALGKTLLVYALLARIPVAIVMLVAMLGNWGTHYDGAPPGLPEMSVFQRWFLTGLIPQMTTWIAFTVLVGVLFGSVAGALASRRSVTPAARPAVA